VFDQQEEAAMSATEQKSGAGEVPNLRLVMTCGACPEQYDVFLGDSQVQVGYLRLRHGYFYAQCPDVGGEYVYEAEPEGGGIFEEHERERYLGEARAAIARWLIRTQSSPDAGVER